MLHTKFQFIWESSFRGEDFFRNQPIRNKNGLWRPCLLMDRDKIPALVYFIHGVRLLTLQQPCVSYGASYLFLQLPKKKS